MSRMLYQAWRELKSGNSSSVRSPAVQEVECKAAEHAHDRILMAQRSDCLKATMLVLLALTCCEDERHTTRRSLAFELNLYQQTALDHAEHRIAAEI
jgi:hypothetical protein